MHRFERLVFFALVVIAVAALALAGFALRGDRDPLSLFWPCGGFVYAVLLVSQRRDWPALVASTVLGIAIADRLRFGTLHPYLMIAALEPLLAAHLVRRHSRRGDTDSRFLSWLRMMSWGPVFAAGIGGALGAALLVRAEPEFGYFPLMRSWWLADAIGYILVTPAAYTIVSAWRSPRNDRRFVFDRFELAAFLAAFAIFTGVVFGGMGSTGRSLISFEHAVLPLLLWAALRFPWWVSTNALLVYYAVAAWQTTRGIGPFYSPDVAGWSSVMEFQASALTSAIGVQLVLALATERRLASANLEVSDRRFRDIVESTNEWIWEVDADLRFVYSSPHSLALLGYAPEELVGRDSLDLAVAEDRSRLIEQFEQGVALGRPAQSILHRLCRKDGGIVHLESNVVPIFDEEGRVVGCRGMDRDVGERIAADIDARSLGQNFARSERLAALGAVVSGVAHEINNPNQFIALNMPIVKQAWQDVEPAIAEYATRKPDWCVAGLAPREAVREIGDAIDEVGEGSDRIRSIVAELKDYLRGDPAQESDPIDLAECIRSVLNLVAGPINAREPGIELALEEGLPFVRGHRRRIEQVLINLLTNARQALEGRAGSVRVRTKRSDDARSVTIEIEDDGVGIPEEDLARVMEPFFSTKRKSGGMGLGLAVSAQIAREHGGRLEIDSRVGVGTTARLVLPVAPHDPS